MDNQKIIDETINFVKTKLKNVESGHDWWHIYRVWNNAKLINKTEKADQLIVELGSLLHDIADSKFHDGDETIGPRVATEFLTSQNINPEIIDHITKIIENISFKGGNEIQKFKSHELDVIQDADRLDAIGAIGIARCFNFGGYFNYPLYDPNIPPNPNMSKEEYKKRNTTSLNHFYEKLFLLKDRMNTKTSKEIALQRHEFIVNYVDQFLAEWYGKK